MWFNPVELSKTQTIPSANLANSANYEPVSIKTDAPISKLAGLAAPDNQKFEIDAAVEWMELPEPSPGALMVTCYTPNGKVIEVEARNQEHAEFLQRMNPYREAK